MKKKIALITGVNGQDGAYLAKALIKKNIKVYGLIRRTSNYKIQRLEYFRINNKINFIHGELNESKLLEDIIKTLKPDFIYNLAAQSFVQYSFENPNYTMDINCISVLNMLETIRRNKIKTRFYQASTSEMFGNSNLKFQNENTAFSPVSPYGISKVAAHNYVKNYRESFSMFACSGILFNHESPLRGVEFVTKKIINQLVNIKRNKKANPIKLGNIYSKRDWGFAGDYTDAMIKILNSKTPKDYVVATGKNYSVKDFFIKAAKILGFNPIFKGKGINEVSYDKKTGRKIMSISKEYYRKNELNYLLGDSSLIRKELKWYPKITYNELIKLMIDVENDIHFKKFKLSINNF